MNTGVNPSTGAQLQARLPATPDVYLHKLDLAKNAGLLIEFDLPAYRQSSFLDNRVLTPATKGVWLPLSGVMTAASRAHNLRPLHYIFHTGHVGSTLISRLLDEIAGVFSLREPLPLRSLATLYDEIDQPGAWREHQQFTALARALIQLWSRGYQATHSIFVKATSAAARVAAPLLTLQPAARALYLNVGAEPYLAALLAGPNCDADLRGHGPGRLRRLQQRLDVQLAPMDTMSICELAAMGWLVESWTQRDVVSEFGARILAVNFDEFLSNIPSGMSRITQHFALPADHAWLAQVAHNPVLSRYSKAPDHAYSPKIRAQVLAESRQKNRAEIAKGMQWLEHLAQAHPGIAKVLEKP
jgi:hypothetical protein